MDVCIDSRSVGLTTRIAAGLYCLATSPGFLPTLCEKWSGFFYVHRVYLSYTRDRRLKVSSERLGNEDKAPCPRVLLPGRGSNRGPPLWKSEALTARPRQYSLSPGCCHSSLIHLTAVRGSEYSRLAVFATYFKVAATSLKQDYTLTTLARIHNLVPKLVLCSSVGRLCFLYM